MPKRHAPARIGACLAAASGVLTGILASCGTDQKPAPAATPLSARAAEGRDIAQRTGCANCHSADGKPGTGPTWKGTWGTEVALTDGRTTIIDDDYVHRAIDEPQADRRQNYASVMPKFELTEDQVAAVTAYIRELSGRSPTNGGTTQR